MESNFIPFRFKVEEGKLFYNKEGLWVEVIFSKGQQAHIIKACHNDATAGHLGRTRTLSGRYYWPGIFGDVTRAVSLHALF